MKNDALYLKHILDAIEKIRHLVREKDKGSFASDQAVYYGSLYLLATIGEAASNLSNTFKEEHADIPWKDVKDMRNVLIHEYFNVSAGIVWKTIVERLPELEKVVRRALEGK